MVIVNFPGKDVPFVPPAIEMMSQGLAYFGIQETVQKRHDKSLCAEKNGSRDGKYVASNPTLAWAIDNDEVGDT